jgi:hypothetical protein
MKLRFRYVIQTLEGESGPMDSLFLFFRSRIFQVFGLTSDLKMRYGCIYPYGICSNQFNSKRLDYLNVVRHERTLYKVCVTAQKMRVGPSEPAYRSRLQTT